jgi:hypothetical protein
MIRQPATQPPSGRGIPRIRRWATGLTVTATAFLAAAPAALADPRPAPDGGGPLPPPPPVRAVAYLPLWAVVAIVAATVVLSVATTLITLAVEHIRQARRTPVGTEAQAGHGDIIASHHYPAG